MKTRPIRLIGLAILLVTFGISWWAYQRTLSDLEEFKAAVGQLESADSEVHLHDTYYVSPNPGFAATIFLGLGLGLTALLFPRTVWKLLGQKEG